MLSSPYATSKSRGGRTPTTQSATAVPSSAEAAISNAELTDLYASCIKLCTENKINQKNSWSLNLIDYISDVLDTRHGEMTNFQVASCTLDASVKIYSCRVDSIHNETFKVLGGLSRSGGGGGSSEGEDDGVGARTNGRKKSNRSVNTIETNPSALNVKKFDLEFDVDPLFHKTSAAFDEGGARGLLLNHLAVRSNGALAFDSGDRRDAVSEAEASAADDVFSIDELHKLLPTGALDRRVCPSLADFTFMGWEPNTKAMARSEWDEELTTAATTAAAAAAAQGGNETSSPLTDFGLNMDAEGGMAPVYDSDFGGDMFSGDEEDGLMPAAAAGPTTTTTVTSGGAAGEIVFALGSGGDEYSYFDEAHLRNWAGPSHWRFRGARAAAADAAAAISSASASGVGGDGKRRKKDRFLIDFHAETPDWTAVLGNSRAATTLAASTLDRAAANADANLLPEDLRYSLRDLTRLFSKPAWRARVAVRAAQACGGDNGLDVAPEGDAWYDYDNPNDANNYCAPMDDGGDMMMDGAAPGEDSDFGGAEDWTPAQSASAGGDGNLQLVAEPDKVQKIEINYAKNAKRVNVKQLKSKMWSELTTEEENKENAATAVTTADISGKNRVFTDVTQPHSFAGLVRDVPAKVGGRAAENLSVPIMFVALLHLANEKHLKITGAETLSDLSVIQG
eukprot:UC1_evm1s2114